MKTGFGKLFSQKRMILLLISQTLLAMSGIDFHINNFTALSVGDILPVLSPPSGLVKLII
jgi:hypothetical protein